MRTDRNRKDRGFSGREVRALVWLLPVLAVASWLVFEIARPGGPGDGRRAGEATPTVSPSTAPIIATGAEEGDRHDSPTTLDPKLSTADAPAQQLFSFDPNTVEYHDLIRLGFERREALGIVKYRERGKIFEIPEDFASCYQVSEAMYRRLEPYIKIGEEFRLKKRQTVSGKPRVSSRAEEYTEYPSSEEASRGRGNDTRTGNRAAGRSDKPPVDLNTADSATLIAVSGIGERTAVSIMEYRARLGGFADVRQLAEVRGVTEQNYERMVREIFADPATIQKIDINFAPAKTLAAHPYIRAEALRKLLKQRQLKGGWRTVEELASDDIFTTEELEKLGLYLVFN